MEFSQAGHESCRKRLELTRIVGWCQRSGWHHNQIRRPTSPPTTSHLRRGDTRGVSSCSQSGSSSHELEAPSPPEEKMKTYHLLSVIPLILVVSCTGPAGRDGESATSCTVSRDEAAGTSTIACEDGTTVVVPDGGDGDDGVSCTVARDDDTGVSLIQCDDGTEFTWDGGNGEGCTVEEEGGTYTMTCSDGTAVTWTSGAGDGGSGSPTLIRTDEELRVPSASVLNPNYFQDVKRQQELFAQRQACVDADAGVRRAQAKGVQPYEFRLERIVETYVGERRGDQPSGLGACATRSSASPKFHGSHSSGWALTASGFLSSASR